MKEHLPTCAPAGRAGDNCEEGRAGATAQPGKALVRELLVKRADEAGLQRPRGVSAEAHAQMVDRLCEHLAYMAAENLKTLAELVIEAGGGPARTWWPAEVTVRGLAQALQARPLQQHRIVTSWLASVEGPVAEASGHLVELYRFLRRHRRPPMAMDQRQLREEAAENRRRMGLVQDRIQRGAASDDDRGWMASYLEDQREAQGIVDAGRGARSVKASGGAGDGEAA